MNSFVLILCLVFKLSSSISILKNSGEDVLHTEVSSGYKTSNEAQPINPTPTFGKLDSRKAKPLKSIFMGLYKNYKSTYLGNRTTSEYTKSLKTNEEPVQTVESVNAWHENAEENSKKIKRKRKNKCKKRRSTVKKSDPLMASHEHEYQYQVGPGVNVTLDMQKDIVSVNLDENNLKDIFLGEWVGDSGEGRGKKHEMLSKILPLFILPFLIQSAIVPFLVSKLKLLLLKSIVVGKIAIFLLIISALKNSSKHAGHYETAPAYWSGEPSRRSEAYGPGPVPGSGYKFEGRPTSWAN